MSTQPIALEPYVIDVLMPDLVGHDRRPSAWILYLALVRLADHGGGASLKSLSAATGLSKTAVQRSVAHLKRRGLIEVEATGPTHAPRYRVLTPWRR